ncbi:MAG: dTDP-4-dehydrorhamnose 3,5-epimerase [bacterium]|nr:dTDP-4-dehydrorhamnose 3,5-epimerase [bacterium]
MSIRVQKIATRRFSDDRGWFSETYPAPKLLDIGIDTVFIQDNQSFSSTIGTIRGIQFQRPPHAQAKLVRCVKGGILDYAVDLRKGSPTFGRYVVADLSADNGCQLYVPIGFGHAFVTLEADTEIAYKVSDIYAPDCDGGVAWKDPTIAIDWPVPQDGAVLSDKDRKLPPLSEFDSPFEYDAPPSGRY